MREAHQGDLPDIEEELEKTLQVHVVLAKSVRDENYPDSDSPLRALLTNTQVGLDCYFGFRRQAEKNVSTAAKWRELCRKTLLEALEKFPVPDAVIVAFEFDGTTSDNCCDVTVHVLDTHASSPAFKSAESETRWPKNSNDPGADPTVALGDQIARLVAPREWFVKRVSNSSGNGSSYWCELSPSTSFARQDDVYIRIDHQTSGMIVVVGPESSDGNVQGRVFEGWCYDLDSDSLEPENLDAKKPYKLKLQFVQNGGWSKYFSSEARALLLLENWDTHLPSSITAESFTQKVGDKLRDHFPLETLEVFDEKLKSSRMYKLAFVGGGKSRRDQNSVHGKVEESVNGKPRDSQHYEISFKSSEDTAIKDTALDMFRKYLEMISDGPDDQ